MNLKSHSARIAIATAAALCLWLSPRYAAADTTTNAVIALTGTAGGDLLQNTSSNNAWAILSFTNNSPHTALAQAAGVAGLAGDDRITSTAPIQAGAQSTIDLAMFGSFDYMGKEAIAQSVGLSGGAGQDAATNTAALTATATANTDIDEVIGTVVLGFGATGLPAIADASATGLDGGDALDTLINSGQLTISANATSAVFKVRVTTIDMPLDVLGLSDARTLANASAVGLSGGTNSGAGGPQSIWNNGALNIQAAAAARATEITYEPMGASLIDDRTIATTLAAGITGDAADDQISHSGTMNVGAVSTSQITLVRFKGEDLFLEEIFDAFGLMASQFGTSTEAQALGIDGGAGNDTLLSAQTNGVVSIRAAAETDSTSVDVNIEAPEFKKKTAMSPSAAPLSQGSSSVDWITTDTNSFGFVTADTTAWAGAAGMTGGQGNDLVDNRSWQQIVAESWADSWTVVADLALSLSNSWNPIPGTAFARSGTSARSEAFGLDGGEGNDTLLNSGRIEVTANAAANANTIVASFKGSAKGLNTGVTLIKTGTEAIARSTGLAGGAGDDAITNQAAIVAASSAKAGTLGITAQVTGDKAGVAAGVSIADAKTVATGRTIGIDSGTGNDVVHNTASVAASGYSEFSATMVTAALNATLEGLAGNVTVADMSLHATNVAAGVHDIGGDTLVNSGTIGATARAQGNSTAVNANISGGKVGVALGVTLSDATSTTRAEAYGVDFGEEISTNGFLGDAILNTGSIAAVATSTNDSLGVTATITAELNGVVGGASATRSDITSEAAAAAIRTGSGDDHVVSDGAGSLGANAVAKTASTHVAATISGAWKGLSMGAALADSRTAATAASAGIATGSGADTIVNRTALTNSAVADADSVTVAATFSGAWMGAAFGVSMLDGRTMAAAGASGIGSGADNDAITNQAAITTSASADSESVNISVTVAVAPKGVSAGLAMATVGMESMAAATGISAGAGDDIIDNTGALDVDATAKATVDTIVVDIATIGAAMVDASTTVRADSIGIDGGAGIDNLRNAGRVDATATSTIDATSTVVNFAGYASGNGRMTNSATAIGMRSSLGEAQVSGETIHNAAGGSVNALAQTTTDLRQATWQGGGGEIVEAGAVSQAAAYGLLGSRGADVILNAGTNSATALTVINSTSTSFQLFGIQLGTAGVNGLSIATAIEGLAGADAITNTATGRIAAYASSDTTAANLSAGIGASFGLMGATSEAVSRGIHTGAEADTIVNDGAIDVTGESAGSAGAVSIGLFGFDLTSTLANTTVEGINAGGGNDWIRNSGSIVAGQVHAGDTSLVYAASAAVSLDVFANSLAALGAKATVAGIAGAGGDDFIFNTGRIAVGDTNDWMAWGQADSVGGQFFGSANTYCGGTATGTGTGMDGGDGTDVLVNGGSGVIEINTRSGSQAKSWAYDVGGFLMPSTADASATANATAIGINGGAGADFAGNAGLVNANAYALALAESDGEISFDIATRVNAESHAYANATAAGIDLGAGNNYGENTGTINATATALGRAYSESSALFESTVSDAYSTPVAVATGIAGGNDGNTISNAVSGIINASANAKTTDALGNATYGYSSGREAYGNAGTKTSPVTARATGIATGAGEDWVRNDGTITANARADGIASANADVWWVYPVSDAKANVAAIAKGIAAGTGPNTVINNGRIAVTNLDNTSTSAKAYSSFCTSTTHSSANSTNGIAIGIEADGVVTNTANGNITVTGRAITYGESWTSAENTYAYGNLLARAVGITPASSGAAPRDLIVNEGNLGVTAVAGENADGTVPWSSWVNTSISVTSIRGEGNTTSSAQAIGIRLLDRDGTIINSSNIAVAARARACAFAQAHSDLVHPAAVTVASADSLARGIVVGNGNDVLFNDGVITVSSYANAYAYSWSDEDVSFWRNEESRATAYANARVYGVQTGNGNNLIVNNGTITATALALTSLYAETEDNDDEYRTQSATASAVGIQTGSGDDVIINNGTISAEWKNDTDWLAPAQLGSAILSGAGNDTVVLLSNSITRGAIALGDGNDVLQIQGAPSITGTVDGQNGIDRMVLDGAGALTGLYPGFEQVAKLNEGAFRLNQLSGVNWIELQGGTLQVLNNYQFASTGLCYAYFSVDGPAGDMLVSGTANLAGALSVQRTGGGVFTNGAQFDFIFANRITNTFTSEILPASSPLLGYDVLYLNEGGQGIVRLVSVVNSFSMVASNRLERDIARYLDRVLPIAAEGDGDFEAVLGEFQRLSGSDFGPAFASFSPAVYDANAVVTFANTRDYTRLLQQHLRAERAALAMSGGDRSPARGSLDLPVQLASAPGYGGGLGAGTGAAAAGPEPVVWASGFGGWDDVSAADGFAAYNYSGIGTAFGLDYAFSDQLLAGAALWYSSARLDLEGDQGHGEVNSYGGSVYGTRMFTRSYLEGAFSYGRNSYENSRRVLVGGIQRTARSEHDGNVVSIMAGGGTTVNSAAFDLQPFCSLLYTCLMEEGYAETGADSLNMRVSRRDTHSLKSELGVRFTRSIPVKDWTLVPNAALAWEHDFGIDDRDIRMTLAGAPGVSLAIAGPDTAPDSTAVRFGLTLLGQHGVSTSLNYDGLFNPDGNSHVLSGFLRIAF